MLIGEAVRSERGFGLIEVLVAAMTSVVVAGALFGILVISTHQSKLLTDRVQAVQTSRTTMNKLVNELHSVCLAADFAPVRSPVGKESGPSRFVFVNAYTPTAAIPAASEKPAEGAYLHEVEYVAGANGKLVDKAYPSTSVASWPEITFAKNPSTQTVLGEHISAAGAAPLFEYYRYATKATAESPSAPVGTLETMGVNAVLSETGAQQVASVLIRFTTVPANSDTRASRSVSLSNQVTFAFSAPSSETPISDSPCE